VAAACVVFASAASADGRFGKGIGNAPCDVVSLNGTGILLEGGQIEGTEILQIIDSGKQIEVDFSLVTLGTVGVDPTTGAATLITSHDFASVNGRKVSFTTLDEIQVFPLNGSDVTCTTNPCGLIFRLAVETGRGRYNCGEIVSGLNPDPLALIPFTSYVNPFAPADNGDTVFLNSLGKLCNCGDSR
jgi:hypothetical protein